MNDAIRFTLNGKPVTLETDGDRSLLWALRTDLELTGTKYGCGAGLCGSCTVIVDGRAVRSCVTDLNDVQGAEVTTIEGLAPNGRLHPLQQAFYEQGAYPVRLLHSRYAHECLRSASRETRGQPRRDRAGHGEQPLSLLGLQEDRRGDRDGLRENGRRP